MKQYSLLMFNAIQAQLITVWILHKSFNVHTISYLPHSEMQQKARLVFCIKFVIWTVPT